MVFGFIWCFISPLFIIRAPGTPAYQAPQTGYAVAQTAAAAAAATYSTQRAATGYDTYQAATHTTPGTYAGNF